MFSNFFKEMKLQNVATDNWLLISQGNTMDNFFFRVVFAILGIAS